MIKGYLRRFTGLAGLLSVFSAAALPAYSAEPPRFTLPDTWIEGQALAPNIWFAFKPDSKMKAPLSELPHVALQEHDAGDSKIEKLREELGISSSGCKEVPASERSKGTKQTWCFTKKNAWALLETGSPALADATRREILDQMNEWVRRGSR